MFTFKKIALLGAAGLAALSMSCSDKADDPSGTITGLTITDSAAGIILAGTITANDGIQVASVTATADGNAVEIKKGTDATSINVGLPQPSVSLAGAYLSGVCGTTTGTKTFKIVITATFDDATSIDESKDVSVACGGGSQQQTGTYTLSAAGESYLDVDAGVKYKQSQLTTAAIKESIDLAAFWTNNAGDNIYSGSYGNVTTLDDESLARIFATQAALTGAAEDDVGEASIAITSGGTFYLESSELDPFKVTVNTFTAGSSVTLKVEPLP